VPQRQQRPETTTAANRLASADPTDLPQAQARPVSPDMAFQQRGEGSQSGSGDTSQFALAARQARLSVARQETHLVPAALSSNASPLQQITNRIASEMDPAELTRAELAQEPGLTAPSSNSPVKTLSIRLDPPELGSLSIRMSLKDDVLQLQVEASRQETAALLQRDQETLQKMLRSAGYGLDGMTVQITSADRGGNPPSFAGAGSFQQPSGQNPAWRQEERASGDNLSGQRQGNGNGNGEAGHDAGNAAIDPRRGDSVYL
jgi:flagellar hook-length control protein FliK